VVRRRASLLAPLLLLASQASAVAQVVPGGLGTRVNGSALGRCSSGVCRIQGGTPVGGNLLLRLNRYDTRSGIERVDLDTQQRQTVVVGVGDPAGSFFATPLKLNAPANLVWLSPGGLWLGAGMQVINAPSQLFTTSPSLRLGHGVFQAAGGEGPLGGLGRAVDLAPGNPGEGSVGQRLGLGGSAPIVLAGGHLLVDRNLVLDSGRGSILSAAGSRTQIRAGGGIELTGGHLDVQKLQVEGGGSVTLQALADGGQARLRQSEIVGQQVLLRGNGGFSVEDLTVRSNGAGKTGSIRLETANDPTAEGHLRNVNLQGNGVLLRAGGNFSAQQLKAEANQAGSVQLESANGTMALNDTQLLGQQVVVRAARQLNTQGLNTWASDDTAGRTWLEAGQAQLQQTALRGREVVVDSRGDLMVDDLSITTGPTGREGTISLQAGQGNGGKAGASARLSQLKLRGNAIGVISSGQLNCMECNIDADSNGVVGQVSLATGTVEKLNSGGGLGIHKGVLSAKQIQIRAAGGVSLGDVNLRASQGNEDAFVQIDTAAGDGGKTVLNNVDVRGRQVVIGGTKGIEITASRMKAGEAGDRGSIRLETSSGNDPVGDITLMASQLETGTAFLRGNRIAVSDQSRIAAPKGWIYMESTSNNQDTGSLSLSNSRLSVETQLAEDLIVPTETKIEKYGITITESDTPVIGLYASGKINLSNTTLTAAQVFGPASTTMNEAEFDKNAKLSDRSGVIAIDAQSSISISNSSLLTDASHTLAGVIAIRAGQPGKQDGIEISQSNLSSSGGAGGGNIRIQSDHGIHMTDSMLQASSDRLPDTDDKFNDQFGGGLVVLASNSPSGEIRIANTRILSSQHDGGSVYSPLSRKSGLSTQAYSLADQWGSEKKGVTIGGQISILSRGGISVEKNSEISTYTPSSAAAENQDFSGIIRLFDSSRKGISIQDSMLNANADNGDYLDITHNHLSRISEIMVTSSGPITLDRATISAQKTTEPRTDIDTNNVSFTSKEVIKLSNTSLLASNLKLKESSGINGDAAIQLASARADGVTFDSLSQVKILNEPIPIELVDQSPLSADNYNRFRDFNEYTLDFLHASLDSQNLIDAEGERYDRLNTGEKDSISGRVKNIGLGVKPTVFVYQPSSPEPIIVSRSPVINSLNASRSFNEAAWGHTTTHAPLNGLKNPSWTSSGLQKAPPINMTGPKQDSDIHSSVINQSVSTAIPLSRADAKDALENGELLALRQIDKQLGLAPDATRNNTLSSLGPLLQTVQTRTYRPAILRIQLSQNPSGDDDFIEQIMILGSTEIQGWRTKVPRPYVTKLTSTFSTSIAQQASVLDPAQSYQMSQIVFGPSLDALNALGVNAVLLSLDRSLQGIPISAIPYSGGVVGDQFAITLTPSLLITSLKSRHDSQAPIRRLVAGTHTFTNGLVNLPLAQQEMQRIAQLEANTRTLFGKEFSEKALIEALLTTDFNQLHLATHADFQPGGLGGGQIFTSSGQLSLREFSSALKAHGRPYALDLLSVSACRSSLGNEHLELGIAGLALQAGASSALGGMWYVDDAATAAFQIQFYELLKRGFTKDVALQKTQSLFRRGVVRVVKDKIIGMNDQLLVEALSSSDLARLASGLDHPYYWAGFALSGQPW